MRFPEILYAGAFLLAMATTVGVMPLFISICRRAGLVDDPGARKLHGESVPLAGGLGILGAVVLAFAVGAILLWRHFLPGDATDRLVYGVSHRLVQLSVIGSAALAMLSIGLLDDRYEFSAGTKFFGQVVVAFLVAASGIRITLFVPSVVFSYAATVLWILTVVNAFNFMDNMNGLCAGLTAIAAMFFGVTAAVRGDYLVAGFAFFFAGAFCGFLPYNFPKARAFLGDSGSHLAGFIAAVLAILPHFYSNGHPDMLAVMTPLLVLAVPLADLVRVVVIRLRRGEPFYIGDNNHLSHWLTQRGFTSVQAVILIWVLAVTCGVVGLCL
jgi:UDP-GlcNAc:undecaprenyl-phosphate GlcNAc-1-phosphate transferase